MADTAVVVSPARERGLRGGQGAARPVDSIDDRDASARRGAACVRWLARGLAAFFIVLIGGFLFGGGAAGILGETILSSVAGGVFLLIPLAFVLALFQERAGGVLSLASLVAFYALWFASENSLPRGWVFPALALPGVLFVVSGFLHARLR